MVDKLLLILLVLLLPMGILATRQFFGNKEVVEAGIEVVEEQVAEPVENEVEKVEQSVPIMRPQEIRSGCSDFTVLTGGHQIDIQNDMSTGTCRF